MGTQLDEQTEQADEKAPVTAQEPPVDDDEAAEEEEAGQPVEEEEEAPTAGPVTEDQQAQVFDKAIKRAKTYMQAVPLILGDSAVDLELCPRCTDLLPGFVLPPHIKPVTPEQKVAVKLSIGELSTPDLKPADDAFTCGKCDGWGKVLTGSKRPEMSEGKCLECDGRGWIGQRLGKIRALPEHEQVAVNGDGDGLPEPAPATDPWGRTQDDPLFGVMPGFERP